MRRRVYKVRLSVALRVQTVGFRIAEVGVSVMRVGGSIDRFATRIEGEPPRTGSRS